VPLIAARLKIFTEIKLLFLVDVNGKEPHSKLSVEHARAQTDLDGEKDKYV
jgi:hypothetical protein